MNTDGTPSERPARVPKPLRSPAPPDGPSRQTADRMTREIPGQTLAVESAGMISAITDRRKQHRAIATNPFSNEAQAVVDRLALARARGADALAQGASERNRYDAIAQMILFEPKGEYDTHFDSQKTTQTLKPKELIALEEPPRSSAQIERATMLKAEKDTSAYITAQLAQEVLDNMDTYMRTYTREQIYQRLSQVAFLTDDFDTIQRNFSRQQRIGYRLSILNLIRDIEGYKTLEQTALAAEPSDVARRAEFVTGFPRDTFRQSVDMQVTPLGFILELSADDYNRAAPGGKGMGQYIESTLDNQPSQAWGSIIIVNRDTYGEPPDKEGQQKYIRDHELAHAIFGKFLEHKVFFETYDTFQAQQQAQAQHPELAQQTEPIPVAWTDESAELSHIDNTIDTGLGLLFNETLAYITGGITPDLLRGSDFSGYDTTRSFQFFTSRLSGANLPPEEKLRIYKLAQKEYHRFFESARAGRAVISALFGRGRVPLPPDGRKPIGRSAFFSGRLGNDAGRHPYALLRKYVHDYLPGETLESVIGAETLNREKAGQQDGGVLAEYARIEQRALDVRLRVVGQGANAAITRMHESQAQYGPAFIPGALAWLRRDLSRNPRYQDITSNTLPGLNNVLFFHQDTLPIDVLRDMQQALAGLRFGDRPSQTFLTEMQANLQQILAIRTMTFT